MRGVRLAAVGAAGLVFASMGITLANPGDELAACRSTLNGKPQVTIRSDRWVRIAAPKFDSNEGPATISSFSVMPNQKNGLMVTNGTVVKLSMDAGCTWQTVYSGNNVKNPAPGAPYTPDVFTQIVEPSDTLAWVTSYDDVGGVPHPHVYTGSEVGKNPTPTWGQDDVGLPEYGKPVSLVVPFPGLGEAYLLVDQLPDPTTGSTATTRHLYATQPPNPPQAGAVAPRPWSEVTLPSGFGRVDGVARESAGKVWIWSGRHYAWASGLDNSTSPTWHVGTAAGTIITIDVADSTGIVNVIEQIGSGALIAEPGQGGLVTQMKLPVVPYSFTHGTYQNVYAESGPNGTWGYDHVRHQWINITPHGGGPAFHQLTMAYGTSERVLLGMTSSALWRWDTYDTETFRAPPPPPGAKGPPPRLPHSNLKTPVLTPTKKVVTVTPGAVSKVPVAFLVPPDATPLDVYFLVDTTSSMGPAILGLQKSIVTLSRHLRSELGLSACFGVGGVKDFDPQSSYVFKTFQPVAPCDTTPDLASVTAATKQLESSGGGTPPEAQTLALKLAVNGQMSVNPPVPVPQPANFRPGAFHVIVYISDAGSNQGGGYPTIAEDINTLNTNDVKIVSIAYQHGGGDLNAALAMMNQLAVGTGSYGPASGVDCNGDGGGHYGDLGPNAPLICQESASSSPDGPPMVNIEPAIFGLLLAVKDPGTVGVTVGDPDHALQAPIEGPTSRVLDMKYETGVKFTMPVGCTASQVGKTLRIGLTPRIRSQAYGSPGEVDVICQAKPKLPPIPPVAPAAPLLFFPGARPPVAVAPPIPPNPPAQPASNVNPNAGMAREEQQQPQLAMAAQDSEAAGEDTEVVEMSAMRNPSPRSDALFIGGAAMLMAAAAGCAMQLRRRTAFVRQGR